MENNVWIGLGSNTEDRIVYLKNVLDELKICETIDIILMSSVYETKPIGYKNQRDFLNMVIKISTVLAPEELLHYMLNLENKLGRVRSKRWGPRNIDIDLLIYNDVNIGTELLILPHPRMYERCFVLIPLLETLTDSEEVLKKEVEGALKCLSGENCLVKRIGTCKETNENIEVFADE